MKMERRGLGRGLDALFGGAGEASTILSGGEKQSLPLDKIIPNVEQPRRDFAEESLQELASSIAREGVLQPILVRPVEGGNYQIVAGERRFRASKMAGLKSIPVVVRELDDEQALGIALIENLQREDLNPMEEALGYEVLRNRFALSQEEISVRVGKSRPAVANTLRLLQLPGFLQEDVASGSITSGHARSLLAVEDPAAQLQMRDTILKEQPSVREVEGWVSFWKKNSRLPFGGETSKKSRELDGTHQSFPVLQKQIAEYLGLKAVLQGNFEKGYLKIQFGSRDEFVGLLKAMGLKAK